MERDYNGVMLRDAIMSHNPELTGAVEDYMESIGYQTLELMLQNAAK
jgi:hypothetical protein